MKSWLRRIRGALGMGVTWMLGWGAVGILYGVAVFLITGGQIPISWALVIGVQIFGGLGLMAGAIFSFVLGIAERRNRFDELRAGRFAIWGAVGGGLLGLLAVVNGAAGPGVLDKVMVLSLTTVLATGSAMGTLAIARGSSDRLLADGSGETTDVESAGLSETEKRELLGS